MLTNRTIDHIVYAVSDLSKAIDDFEATTGIRPMFGGYHLTKGTQNALVNLGNQCYLELLAVDPNNEKIAPPRWMGVDLIDRPTITRWALKTNNLEQDSRILKTFASALGTIDGGQRKTSSGKLLTWKMILPLATPQVNILPFMVDWQQSEVHPTDQLPQQCQLLGMGFSHPTPQNLQATWNSLQLDTSISKSEEASIKVIIQSPKGIVELF